MSFGRRNRELTRDDWVTGFVIAACGLVVSGFLAIRVLLADDHAAFKSDLVPVAICAVLFIQATRKLVTWPKD
jgi:hypothetical protein